MQRRTIKELRERVRKQEETIRHLQREIQLLKRPGMAFRMETNGNLIRIEGGKG